MNVLTLKTNTIDGVNGLTLVSSESVGQTHEVRLTPEHPVYVINRYGEEIGWTMATNLVAGDLIADIDGGAAVKVVANALTQTSETVYNFEVEGNHNYFADELGLWVHNASRNPKRDAIIAFFLKFFGDDPSQPEFQFNPDNDPRIEISEPVCPTKIAQGPKPPSKLNFVFQGGNRLYNKLKGFTTKP